VIARRPVSSRAERRRLLGREVEQLTVEAKKLGLELETCRLLLLSTGESSSQWKPGRNDDLEWSSCAGCRCTD